jgi:hypothetical protein
MLTHPGVAAFGALIAHQQGDTGVVPYSRDTTPDADAVQLALYRRMSAADRVRIGHQMSMDARAISLAAIRQRHPEYDDASARWALFRLLLGDELFQKAWPAAPLVAP